MKGNTLFLFIYAHRNIINESNDVCLSIKNGVQFRVFDISDYLSLNDSQDSECREYQRDSVSRLKKSNIRGNNENATVAEISIRKSTFMVYHS